MLAGTIAEAVGACFPAGTGGHARAADLGRGTAVELAAARARGYLLRTPSIPGSDTNNQSRPRPTMASACTTPPLGFVAHTERATWLDGRDPPRLLPGSWNAQQPCEATDRAVASLLGTPSCRLAHEFNHARSPPSPPARPPSPQTYHHIKHLSNPFSNTFA